MIGLGITAVRTAGSGGGLIGAYTLRDLFTTNAGAPLSTPRTAEPGPGTWTLGGTAHSIASSKYTFASVAATEGLVGVTGQPRTDGLAFVVRGLNLSSIGSFVDIGWRQSSGIGANCGPALRLTSSNFIASCGNVLANSDGTPATGTNYDVAVVARAQGGYVLRKLSASSTWTLIWVDDIQSTGTLYPMLSHNTAAGVADTAESFGGVYIPRIFYSASGAIGTVTLSASDCIWRMRCSGTGTQSFRFRKQDANNYWRAERAATTVRLYECVAGSETQRATAAITATANDRLMVNATSTNFIRVYCIRADGTVVVTPAAYTSASNFATATGFSIDDEANYTECEVYARNQGAF